VSTVVIAGLLAVGVVVQVGCCVGVLLMDDAYQRLHYAAAATTVGPVAVALAVVVRESFSAAGLSAVLVAVLLLTGGALVTHATGRAARLREQGRFSIRPDEIEQVPR
jgi:monovalent cation/proton antiporter MnhG/PhaG subunit